MTGGTPLLQCSFPPCASDTAHQKGVPGRQHCFSSRYVTSALVLASRCPGGGPAVAWPWAVARGAAGIPAVQLLTPLCSHCSRGEREGLRRSRMSGAVRQTSPCTPTVRSKTFALPKPARHRAPCSHALPPTMCRARHPGISCSNRQEGQAMGSEIPG